MSLYHHLLAKAARSCWGLIKCLIYVSWLPWVLDQRKPHQNPVYDVINAVINVNLGIARHTYLRAWRPNDDSSRKAGWGGVGVRVRGGGRWVVMFSVSMRADIGRENCGNEYIGDFCRFY